MSEPDTAWRRLPPLSLVANLAPRTWRTLRGSWPLFAAFLLGGRRDSAFILFLVLLFFALAVWSTLIHYATLGYRLHDGTLQIRSGLLNRQVRSLDPSRIQNTELVQNILHKVLGLVELRVETASGTEVEGMLSGLRAGEGNALIAVLDAARRQAPSDTDEADEPTVHVLADADIGDLLRFGATGLRLGAGIAIAVGLGFEGLQLLDPQQYESVPGMFSGLAGVAVVVAFVSGLFLLAVFGAVQRFWGFTLSLTDGRLVAVQGLFTKRRVSLEVRRIQLATVRQPVFRRALGFGTLHMETAAAHVGDGGITSAEAVVPVVDVDDIAPLLGTVLNGADALWQSQLDPPHPRALRRAVMSGAFEGVLIAIPLIWWFGGLAWSLLLLAPAVDAAIGWLDHRHQGWRVSDQMVVSRRGFVNRRTHLLARGKIQSMTLHQGPILRRWDLAQLTIRVAGSRVRLPLLDTETAEALMEQIRPRPARAAHVAPPVPVQ